eukprot:5132914-Amphidinium_carterae.1
MGILFQSYTTSIQNFWGAQYIFCLWQHPYTKEGSCGDCLGSKCSAASLHSVNILFILSTRRWWVNLRVASRSGVAIWANHLPNGRHPTKWRWG